jgi:hypothetical protein
MHDLEKLRLKAQNRLLWSKGVEAVTNAYKQNWTKRENKKPRYNPEQEQGARGGGGGRRGRARGGREGTTELQDDEAEEDHPFKHNHYEDSKLLQHSS